MSVPQTITLLLIQRIMSDGNHPDDTHCKRFCENPLPNEPLSDVIWDDYIQWCMKQDNYVWSFKDYFNEVIMSVPINRKPTADDPLCEQCPSFKLRFRIFDVVQSTGLRIWASLQEVPLDSFFDPDYDPERRRPSDPDNPKRRRIEGEEVKEGANEEE